jgi:hypothetical protein
MKALKILLKIVMPIGAVLILIVGTLIIAPTASAQQPTKTVITQIHINMYFPAPGEPWDYYVAQEVENINNTAGLYNISIDYWYIDEGATEFMYHGFTPTATTRLQTMINITAIGQNTYFDENINILINGSGINMFPATLESLVVNDRAITIGGSTYMQDTNPARLRPSGAPQPPTFHTVTELPDVTIIVNPPPVTVTMPDVEVIVEIPSTLTPSNTATEGAHYITETKTQRITPTGMEAVIIDLFGKYEPIEKLTHGTQAQTLVTVNEDGTSELTRIIEPVTTIEYGINYEWFAGVIFFGIILYSFFRCIGGLLKWK